MTEQKVLTPQAIQRNPQIARAITEAQLLLSYASRNGIQLEHDTIEAVVKAKPGGKMTEDEEVAFWEAFNKLSKAILPVTAESLRSMNTQPDTQSGLSMPWVWWNRKSFARRAVIRFTCSAFVSLGAVLYLQLAWVGGTTLISDIQKDEDRIKVVQTKSRSLESISGDKKEKEKSLGELISEVDELKRQVNSNYTLLKSWSAWGMFYKDREVTTKRYSLSDGQSENLFHTAKIYLEMLQLYLLPLFYGMLGANVYILRTLSEKIKTYTYTEVSNINLTIRLFLGVLGGMVVAWFVKPEGSTEIFKSLSPFAWAFLAGYSVDLVFSALDRFIKIFTNAAATPAPNQQSTPGTKT